ncbi:GNAT family N-acetyltransferase [Nesterenkonia massiliensis]|uniref:GNAT family N-acetyltransferase n=1 Tax=Nesterenkonia massiliensis TaxID=1232429 RepID=UPI00041B33BF|nr:GNAT family N-acetyltransferase [Nesterenkonia massiliensis]
MLPEPMSPGATVLYPDQHGLQVLCADNPQDFQIWLSAWHECAGGDTFSHPAYLAERAGIGERPRAVVFSHCSGSRVLYSFLQRPISQDACGHPVPEGYYDITTPLLYGGPLLAQVEGADAPTVMTDFWERFRDWALTEGIVSEFHRVNPVIGTLPGYPGTFREHAPHVVKSLAGKTEDELLLDTSKDFRRKLRRTREAGMKLLVDETGHHIETFIDLYYATMRRRNADVRFFYDEEFFDMVHRVFEGQIAYLFAIHEGAAVSTEMVLYCGDTAYSFLGATEESSLRTGANIFLSHSAFVYAQSRGVQNYVLTGGITNTEEDSLLRYKFSMAKSGRRSYYTSHQVIDLDRYTQLSACRPESTFFPSYRAPQVSCTGLCSADRKVRT